MIFRSLTSDGDWKFGGGLSSIETANDAIMLGIKTTLQTFLGECFFNTLIGIDWFTLINMRNRDYVILSIKTAIYNCFGVLNVNELEYNFDERRNVTIKYDITTPYADHVLGMVNI